MVLKKRMKTVSVWCGVFVFLLSIGTRTAGAATAPEKILGPAACIDCHKAEYQTLMSMKHQKAFDGAPDFEPLQRQPSAQAILDKLGLRSVKREPCTTCHFTMQAEEARPKAIAGVSCESCHGAAKEWLGVHNNYGTDAKGEKATRETEPPDHRAARLEQSDKLGMIRPDQPYFVAENCFQCHTVPNEELVNKGGHTAGSAFELVSWAQGEVRHNFLLSNGTQNREAPKVLNPANHTRVLYVIGRMLDLEYSLRAAAGATQDGPYIDAMKQRTVTAIDRLKDIQAHAPVLASIIGEMVNAAATARLQPNNQAELIAAVDRVKAAAKKFVAANYDGSQFAALDALIPDAKQYKGKVSDGK